MVKQAKVFFLPVSGEVEKASQAAGRVLAELVEKSGEKLTKELPIKVHTGAEGNVTYIKPQYYEGMIDYLENSGVKPYFTETNMGGGVRGRTKSHVKFAKGQGFTRLPVKIADDGGGTGVAIEGGKHFAKALIAKDLANQNQVLVVSHFKGHSMAGFGGAIKMLSLGFAAKRAKITIHSSVPLAVGEGINWAKARISKRNGQMEWNPKVVWRREGFGQRMVEYAVAAGKGKNYLYVNFLINITANCDCDGSKMEKIYPDIGVLASVDPVAVDKASFDLLEKKVGKPPFSTYKQFEYAEKLGLGTVNYELVEL